MANPREMMQKWPKESHPEIPETFADTVGLSVFDGEVLKVELTTCRMNEPRPPKPPTGSRHVAARLVLTPNCAVDLFNQMQMLMQQLAQAGLITMDKGQPKPSTKPH